MKNVNEINFYRLNNGDYFQFIENIVTLVAKEPTTETVIKDLKEDLPLLQNSFKKEQLTEETKKIVALDVLRDRAFSKLIGVIDAYTYDDEKPENNKAAKELQSLFKIYGNRQITKFDYNKESASLSNLIIDLHDKYASQVALLNLGSTINFMETCNTNFKDFYATRNDGAALLADVVPFTRLRPVVNEHYKTFVRDIESLQRFIPASATEIANLITRINIEVDKFKSLIPNTTAPVAQPTL
jgi:hypothetical protein